MADFQAGDAVALGQVELQRRQHAAAVVAQGTLGVQFAVEAGAITPASSSRSGAGSARAAASVVFQFGARPAARSGRRPAAPARGHRQRGGGAGGLHAVAQDREVARAATAERQPGEGARHVGGGAQGGAQAVGRMGFASIQPQASWRRAMAAGSVSGADSHPPSRRAPGAVRCAARRRAGCARPPSRARRISRLARVAASIASTPDWPAGRGGRGAACAGLGLAHIVERRGGGDRLAIVKLPNASRLAVPNASATAAAGHQRRGGGGFRRARHS